MEIVYIVSPKLNVRDSRTELGEVVPTSIKIPSLLDKGCRIGPNIVTVCYIVNYRITWVHGFTELPFGSFFFHHVITFELI